MNESEPPAAGFDGRAARFVERIYGSAKGELRLQLLWEDMQAQIPGLCSAQSLSVWDAGGGAGQIARRVAGLGHRVLLSDLSAQMLELAAKALGESPVPMQLRHASIAQVSAEREQGAFDLVICHAVLEWLDEPQLALWQLRERMAVGSTLSLMFYNVNSLMLTHALHGNVRKLLAEDFVGHRGGLTPPNPLAASAVYAWLAELDLEIVSECGIRCISEYLPPHPNSDAQLILQLERHYCRKSPFLQLARYVHVVCRRR